MSLLMLFQGGSLAVAGTSLSGVKGRNRRVEIMASNRNAGTTAKDRSKKVAGRVN